MRYAIIVEFAYANVGAYAPDVPGVGVTAPTIDAAITDLRVALEMQFDALVAEGLPIPPPTTPITALAMELDLTAAVGGR